MYQVHSKQSAKVISGKDMDGCGEKKLFCLAFQRCIFLKLWNISASSDLNELCIHLVVMFGNTLWDMHNLLGNQVYIKAHRDFKNTDIIQSKAESAAVPLCHLHPIYSVTCSLFQEWVATTSDFSYLAHTKWQRPRQVTSPPPAQSRWDQLKPHRCVLH